MTRRLPLLLGVAAASALLLAGCAGTATGSSASSSDDGKLNVVASTNVYGEILDEIGGDDIDVTSIISSASQDPHEFEASAKDQLTVKNADLIVQNGGGYDSFIQSLITSSGSTAPVIVGAAAESDYPGEDNLEGFNEHVWYDQEAMSVVADEIADELTKLDPDHADDFSTRVAAFKSRLSELRDSLGAIAADHTGEKVFVTEPVPLYLTTAAGIQNATPPEFSEAVEEGQDVPPATLLESLNLVKNKDVQVVIVNAQTGGAETTQIIDAAKAAGVPVLEFSETLPEGQTYISWMQANVKELGDALKQ
ncbi:metal ABC transporter solute-binding protein, Zn/Mn family [uncultured Microbacterium sp.]|uniref:metal ABC transporter solute-binding protein, Zn/Mn family n=1 Tax=uncultured Microbacterium sp. TaxID=191216 RepID=UPI0035CBD2A7